MELLGNLKDKVAKSKNREDARSIIEDAGMRLTDAELNMVAGGGRVTCSLPESRLFTGNDEAQNVKNVNSVTQNSKTSRSLILKA